jgi:hypothetical protein
MSSSSLDQLLMTLGVQQKPLKLGEDLIKPNLKQYPIEYDFLDRVLYRFGPILYGYHFYDTKDGTLEQAIAWALDRKTNIDADIGDNPKDWVEHLKINILILGPDSDDFQFISQSSNSMFLVLFFSFDGQYYPLIKLTDTSPDLLTKEDKLIKRYLDLDLNRN